MVAWDYDSYTTDDVFEFVEDFKKEPFQVEKMMDDIFSQIMEDFPIESDLEHLLGVVMWTIRKGYQVPKKYLLTIKKVIDELISNGKQNEWHKPQERKKKLLHERKIIISLLMCYYSKDCVLFQCTKISQNNK